MKTVQNRTSTRINFVKKNTVPFKTFASKQDPLPLSFSSIGTFSSDNNALFLSPTPSLALLQLQAQLCDVVKKEGVEAVDVARARMAEAFSILRELKMPVNGYAVECGYWSCWVLSCSWSFLLWSLVITVWSLDCHFSFIGFHVMLTVTLYQFSSQKKKKKNYCINLYLRNSLRYWYLSMISIQFCTKASILMISCKLMDVHKLYVL